jgi:pimeloyl-ACP methyl ester carboxylesterase
MSLPDNPMPSSVPTVDQTLVLPDGRRLGYALWGEPGGTPVLLVGTSPGSRLFCPDLPATVAAGVRLVTVDRPGSGRSDPDPHPGMARWVADTGALVDHLRLGRFGLVGWSGGGQFALAAAAGLPDRVTSVALAGTPAPAHNDLGDWPPAEIRQLVGLVRNDPKAPSRASRPPTSGTRPTPSCPCSCGVPPATRLPATCRRSPRRWR